MFSCKVCKEKDQRIADLKAQLAAMTAMVQGVINPRYSTAVQAEMNFALDGASTQVPSQPDEQKTQEMLLVEKQAIEMLSGAYN